MLPSDVINMNVVFTDFAETMLGDIAGCVEM
jgi:hypothetical protein